MDATATRPTTRLPLRAELLLKILIRYRGKNTHCWPSRQKLGEELGIAVKTVSFWLAHLSKAGLIEIESTGRSNNYWIPPRPRQESGSQSSRNREVRVPEIGKSEFPKSGRVVDAPIYELDSAAASASAAAAAKSAEESEKTVKELEEIGMPPIVQESAESQPSLAEAILAHCRWRFADQRGLAPIANRSGYIVRCFRDPEACGFMKDDDGEWHTPPGQPRPRSRDAPEHPAVEEHLKWIQAYEAESVDAKERVEAYARDKYPLFAKHSRASHALKSVCVSIYKQWKLEGKL